MPDVVRLTDLRETPLDVDEVVSSLDDDASGGLTLFVGRVRDHDRGLGVVGLDYSAHPTALAVLRDRAIASTPCHAIAAIVAMMNSATSTSTSVKPRCTFFIIGSGTCRSRR